MATKAAAKPRAKKGANGYLKPKAIPLGDILVDNQKKRYKVGPVIGSGGFGAIYSACNADNITSVADYPYVIKIEPHDNGPLFVEMHFYTRTAKAEDIKKFASSHGMKHLGMPCFYGSGSHDLQGVKHRFLVLPRYGKDVWNLFLANDRKFPEHTVYRIAMQMLDVLQYIHNATYVHADIKGANILLGLGKNGNSQVYLVDFGLASHYTSKDFKPDPKKMHNGTIEYTSRDAHNGVPTMRSDLEILAYNLVDWMGKQLPWVAAKLLANPKKVQESKEEFMKDVEKSMRDLFGATTPAPILRFLKYVADLRFNETPNYKKCREMFEAGLKKLGKTNAGDLEFSLSKTPKSKVAVKENIKSRTKPIKMVVDSDEDEDDFVSTPKKTVKSRKRLASVDWKSPTVKSDADKGSKSDKESKSKKSKESGSLVVNNEKNDGKRHKKTKGNTYEINLDLDISMDANVIVNVKRRKKTSTATKQNDEDSDLGTPVAQVKTVKVKRKVKTATTPSRISPRNPN